MTSSLLAPTHVVRGWELLNGAVFSALSLWCLIAGACLNVRLIGFKPVDGNFIKADSLSGPIRKAHSGQGSWSEWVEYLYLRWSSRWDGSAVAPESIPQESLRLEVRVFAPLEKIGRAYVRGQRQDLGLKRQKFWSGLICSKTFDHLHDLDKI